jgi:L-alanine-DL-glutamate epimerase-like enolase superfamily enzyme
MSTYEQLAALPVEIESYSLDRLEQKVSSGFARVTTVIRLRGGGEEGIGEDVTYDAKAHPPPADLPLAGSHALDGFSELVGRLALFPDAPQMGAFHLYRRWAFESAALDLALRQAGRSLAEALEREPRPITFVVSMRLGDPASIEPLRRLLERYPSTRLKLDPTSDWDERLLEQVAATGAVDSVDLKGAYKGTVVDQPPDPGLYARVVEALPDAWIEDPALTPETEAVLAPHRDRITWDAPIHSVADVEALPFPPRMLNVKPSRVGGVRALLDLYDYCAERGIRTYGGGQFELGPGRGQIQYLASLFHPDAPNDVAPGGYNEQTPPAGLPVSPLPAAPEPVGFRRRDAA